MALILTSDQLDDMVGYYLEQPEFTFDVETIGADRLNPQTASVVWLSLATAGRSDVIPMGHPNGELSIERFKLNTKGQQRLDRGVAREDLNPRYDFRTEKEFLFTPPPDQLERGFVFDRMRPLFQSEALKIAHNIKFDLHAVSKYLGFYPAGPYYDTMLVAWLLDVSSKGRLKLEDCASTYLGAAMEKGVGKDISIHSFKDVAAYSLIDSEVTYKLKQALDKRIAKAGNQVRMLCDLEMALLHPVLEMESTGVVIDTDALAVIDKDLRAKIDMAQAEVYKAAGRRFNIRSNRDKQEILFLPKIDGGRGLRGITVLNGSKDKDRGDLTHLDWSVDHETLDHYKDKDTVCSALIEFSSLTKLHGTYVLPYLGGIPIRDTEKVPKYVESRLRRGRVHGTFKQNGAESGRFSSSDPNLQNIPARSKDGKKLREIFVADPGHQLIVADYSQIEPRIIASLSGDKTMIDTYNDGGDVYLVVGDRVGVPRPTGKELVLSIAYGIGPSTISTRIGCSSKEARDLMDFFNVKFPAITTHKNKVLARARAKKYSETVFGRRRPLPALGWSDPDLRSAAERQAYNHVIQGTAADIMKIALVNIYGALPEEARMLMTVHDEVVIQVPDDMEDVSEIVRREMESARPNSLVVPLVADVSMGINWGAAKP